MIANIEGSSGRASSSRDTIFTVARRFQGTQPKLFPDIELAHAQPEPRGFRYQEEIVSPEEETALAAAINQIHPKPFEFHGYVANRRVASFGVRYDFGSRRIEAADDMPA